MSNGTKTCPRRSPLQELVEGPLPGGRRAAVAVSTPSMSNRAASNLLEVRKASEVICSVFREPGDANIVTRRIRTGVTQRRPCLGIRRARRSPAIAPARAYYIKQAPSRRHPFEPATSRLTQANSRDNSPRSLRNSGCGRTRSVIRKKLKCTCPHIVTVLVVVLSATAAYGQ